MSRVCHETGEGLRNPFYEMSVFLRNEDGRLAYSNKGVNLRPSALQRVREDLKENATQLEERVGFAVDGVTGVEGGLTGNVQISAGVYVTHDHYRYLERRICEQRLPRCARDLLRNPEWIEKVDGQWRKAQWAEGLYVNIE